jgi:hypothetical protein
MATILLRVASRTLSNSPRIVSRPPSTISSWNITQWLASIASVTSRGR